jgi:hypothetical protein
LALVERYMIDAEEAERRTQRAAEEKARREEAEARARRIAEERARRAEAAAQTARAAEERARRKKLIHSVEPKAELDAAAAVAHAVVEPPAPAPDPGEATEDLPVYAWVRSAPSSPTETADWTRALVETKEARRHGVRRV